jgi:hypothetical protein
LPQPAQATGRVHKQCKRPGLQAVAVSAAGVAVGKRPRLHSYDRVTASGMYVAGRPDGRGMLDSNGVSSLFLYLFEISFM